MADRGRRDPPRPARRGQPGRLRRRLCCLRGAADPVGTVGGLRRPDGIRPAACRPQGPRGPGRPGTRTARALLLIPARIRHGRPLRLAAAHPRRCGPGRDRRAVGGGRPGSVRCRRRSGRLGGADRAGGSRPATGTVNPDGCRTRARGARRVILYPPGMGRDPQSGRPGRAKSGRPDRTASPGQGYGRPLSQPMPGHRPKNHPPLPTGHGQENQRQEKQARMVSRETQKMATAKDIPAGQRDDRGGNAYGKRSRPDHRASRKNTPVIHRQIFNAAPFTAIIEME